MLDDSVFARMPRPRIEIEERLASGAECHVCEVRGEFAGFIWLRAGWHEEHLAGCRYQVPDDAVWDFDVFVVPKFRLGRTLARMWAAVDADLQSRGVRWSFSCISLFNRPSIGSHERLGARRVGTVIFFRFGCLQLTWLPGCRLPHVGTHAGTLSIRPPDVLSH